MAKMTNGLIAFGVVGALAAASVSERGSFVVGFFWLMFGGIAGMLAMMASKSEKVGGCSDAALEEQSDTTGHPFSNVSAVMRINDASAEGQKEAFVDGNGVLRYPGDVFDFENHPTPGAHSRI